MNKTINIAVVGLGQVGIYLYNELNSKKKEIEKYTIENIPSNLARDFSNPHSKNDFIVLS